MIGEVDIHGVFVPILLVWGIIALLVTALVRRVLNRIGFYRQVWHRPLVDLSLFVIILAVISASFSLWIVR